MAILEVFYAPGKLFSSLENRRGAWVLPFLLNLLLSLGTSLYAIHVVGMESIIRQRLQNTQMSPGQMQQALQSATRPGIIYIAAAQVVIVVALALLIIAGVLTIFALMGSKEPKFSINFSMVNLAYWPYTLIVAIMSILVLLIAPDRTALDINNLLATNVAAFIDKDTTSKGLYSLLTSMDVLSFFEIGLLSYGFSKVNRTSMSFALFSVLSLWFIYVLIRMGLAIIF